MRIWKLVLGTAVALTAISTLDPSLLNKIDLFSEKAGAFLPTSINAIVFLQALSRIGHACLKRGA